MDQELLDWELLHGSDTESTDSITSNNKSASSSVINDGFYESKKTGISGDGEVSLSAFEAADEKLFEGEAIAELDSETLSLETAEGRYFESQSDVQEPIEDLSESWSNSGGNEMVSGDSGIMNTQQDIVSDSGVASAEAIEGSGENTVDVNSAVRSGDESKGRETVWWKMPFLFLKYYSFRIGPVWSVSMAATVMGLVLLGRRLYNMKKKAQRFHLKVTIDDKKVSRVMSQATRLNEMFSEVKRVPLIRPALSSPGAWPVLGLR